MPQPEVTVRRGKQTPKYHWQSPVPIVARAMVLANRTLWVAGPDVKDENVTLAEVGSDQPGQLIALSAEDGTMVSKKDVKATPILDGMIAIPGRILLSCEDGKVRCFTGR
jgi:hypothetical protein